MDREEMALIAPCGINCGDCGVHLGTDKRRVIDALVARGFKKETVNEVRLPCGGCRAVKGDCPVVGGTCETFTCISGRGFDFCFECPDFPCAKLNPAADGAGALPHNLKVFNLCCIQRHGPDAFRQRWPEIKQRYYGGRMEIGRGPQLR